MRPEIERIWQAVTASALPSTFEELFGPAWSEQSSRFLVQETYIIDFKLDVPKKFNEDYGAGIVRLSLAMHNSFGGIIVFGVKDKDQTVSGVTDTFKIEAFNRVLSDITGVSIECFVRDYLINVGGEERGICVLLVPRRGAKPPVMLNGDYGPYKKDSLWIRDRHEARNADAKSLPLLFSDRRELPSDSDSEAPKSLQKSLPPTPATMQHFIGRQAILAKMWNWVVFGNQPRMYLHGPGGSGKSTIAYEFARTLAETGSDVLFPDGGKLDYVLFISGKETELDTQGGKIQKFLLQQFDSSITQFQQILVKSGVHDSDSIAHDEDGLTEQLDDLFTHYQGVIVLDDIDALSRRSVDTGEETLLLKAISAPKRTRIVYTMRNPAAHARKNSIAVPGLNEDEFFSFLSTCCDQFEIPQPDAASIVSIIEESSSLPLLIENIIGLRKYCSSYKEAINQFSEKGGDEARRYLYQREYDGLSRAGKAAEILASLSFCPVSLSFGTIRHLFSFSDEQVRDAISECSGIFLSTETDDNGDTLYTVTPSSRQFLVVVSEKINRSELIKRKVEILIKDNSSLTAAEAVVAMKLEQHVRASEYEEALQVADAIRTDDPVLANPRILSLIGRACANLTGAHRDRARQCFRQASALNHHDINMLRAWFYLERHSGYGIEEAKTICQLAIDNRNFTPRVKSEFFSKLADCHVVDSRSNQGISRDKSIDSCRSSIIAYVKAIELGRMDPSFDLSKTFNWLDGAVNSYCRVVFDQIDEYLAIIERLNHIDIDIEAAQIIVFGVRRLNIRVDKKNAPRLSGIINRYISKISRLMRDTQRGDGWRLFSDTLEKYRDALN